MLTEQRHAVEKPRNEQRTPPDETWLKSDQSLKDSSIWIGVKRPRVRCAVAWPRGQPQSCRRTAMPRSSLVHCMANITSRRWHDGHFGGVSSSTGAGSLVAMAEDAMATVSVTVACCSTHSSV